jgi:hypothetical protein
MGPYLALANKLLNAPRDMQGPILIELRNWGSLVKALVFNTLSAAGDVRELLVSLAAPRVYALHSRPTQSTVCA